MRRINKGNRHRTNRIRRQRFILFVMLGALCILGARITYLKTVKGAEYEGIAKKQQTDIDDTVIVANRGSIVDRNNQAFAVSTRIYEMALDCRVLVNDYDEKVREETLKGLASIDFLSLDYEEMKSYLVQDADGKPAADTHWKVLAKGLSREQKEQIEAMGLKGVEFGTGTKRSYPLGTVAADVIGFIRGDSSWGLENKYNVVLSGIDGRIFRTYDGNTTGMKQTINAQDGSTIVTTLDYNIQQYAEKAIAKAVEDFNPKHAAVLVMNPNTGEIYAMADTPSFDPNDPSTPVNLSDPAFNAKWEEMTNEEQVDYLTDCWRNFNISDTFEPGSIFKPMVVAAALEEGIISENDTFVCNGVKTVYDRDIRCWQRSGHGTQTVEEVLANSCNVAMMEIGEKMGPELFYKYQKDFGFGEKTGVDLIGEASASTLLYAEDAIGPVELATMSFGQSFNCTSLQVLNAFSAVINGGNLMEPHIVSKIIDSNGDITYEKTPTLIRKVISEETSSTVRHYLQSVIDNGTGKKAKIDGYAIGGKTGTAQQAIRANEKYTVTFVGFLPVDDPEIIAIAIIDRPSVYTEGSTSAAPMLKGLLEDIIKYLGIKKIDSAEQNSVAGENTVVLDDMTQYSTNDAITYLDLKNLNYQIAGEGSVITSSVPHAGTEIEEGSTVILYTTKGPNDDNMTITPNIMGRNYEEAIQAVMDAGMSAVVQGDESGVVVKQNPRKGEYVAKGSDVMITFEKTDAGISEGSTSQVPPGTNTITTGGSSGSTPQVPVIQAEEQKPGSPTTTQKTGTSVH